MFHSCHKALRSSEGNTLAVNKSSVSQRSAGSESLYPSESGIGTHTINNNNIIYYYSRVYYFIIVIITCIPNMEGRRSVRDHQ